MNVLHAGCGYAELPDWLKGYSEVRLDIDQECKPDIVASITDLGNIGPYDAVLCNHALEHLYPHQVNQALSEFYRVLNHGGYAAIFVPDLEDARPTDEVLFESPAGLICGLDLFYGLRIALEAQPFMAHHTGFVAQSLERALSNAGFERVSVNRRHTYNLMGVGIKESDGER